MKASQVFLVSCASLLWLETAVAVGDINNADNVAIIGTVKGNVNLGLSKEEIEKIVLTVLDAYQRKSDQKSIDTEQIKQPIATVVSDLSKEGKLGLAAIEALKQRNTAPAKAVVEKETQRVELDAKQRAATYRNLGALAFLDNTQEALQAYRRATQLDPDDADGWNKLGHLLHRVGDLDDAISAYSKVLALGETQQEKGTIAVAYGNLGLIYYTRGDLDKAIEFHQKALTLHEALGNKQGIAADYGNLGIVYDTRGDLDKAIEFYQKALTLNEDLGRKEGMALNYGNLGLVYKTRGDLDKAIGFYQKSLAITEALGMKEISANQYGNLGVIYQTRGDLDKALEFQQNSLTLHEALGNKQGIAADYGNLGSVYKQKGNKAEAKRYWQQSIELYNTLGSPNAKKVQGWLDKL